MRTSVQPISQLYHGPYRVFSHLDNIFSMKIGSRQDTVSIDQLKSVLSLVLSSVLNSLLAWSAPYLRLGFSVYG